MKIINNYIYSIFKRKQIEELNILLIHYHSLSLNLNYSEEERIEFYIKAISYSEKILELNIEQSTINLINAKK